MGVISFRYDVPLEETMAFEAVYQESEQLDLSKKRRIWDAPGSIFVWMFVDGELAGESYGIPLSSSLCGLTDLTDNPLLLEHSTSFFSKAGIGNNSKGSLARSGRRERFWHCLRLCASRKKSGAKCQIRRRVY